MPKIKYFSQEELKKLFKVIKASKSKYSLRNFCMFRLAYRCALRSSEIGLLKLQDYNIQQGELYCQRKKNSQLFNL
ncbi:MAG: tyrosine-type recombinase/integrase [Bacillota bacterium]|nr:tyrosine-type recombinase/integrase [Bacillota bacterium]